MKTILVVDDEPSLRSLIATTLTDDEHRILQAGDGGTAVNLALAEHPDLILLDWMMPGMTGLDVAEQVRANPATRSVPILMLTAVASNKDRDRAKAAGVTDYLVKPFSPLELMGRVRAVLGGAR